MTMQTKVLFAAALCASGVLAADMNVEQRDPVHYTFSSGKGIDLSVVSGNINVIADSSSGIRVEGERVIRAKTNDDAQRAKADVSMETGEAGGVARLHVKYPEHSNNNHYDVAYNLTAHVPSAASLTVRDVNGTLNARGTLGGFDVQSVNGGVTLADIAGSGHVTTVNGPMKVSFRENPPQASTFKTVNGRIETHFHAGLNADISIHTVNGAAFTDFPSSSHNFKAGSGGPAMTFETVNGEIRIHKQ